MDLRQGKLTSQTPSWYASFWVNHRVYLKIESALSPFPIKVWFKTALKYIHFFLPQEIVFSNIIHYILLVKTTITFSENLRSLKSLCPPPNRKKKIGLSRELVGKFPVQWRPVKLYIEKLTDCGGKILLKKRRIFLFTRRENVIFSYSDLIQIVRNCSLLKAKKNKKKTAKTYGFYDNMGAIRRLFPS